MASEFPDGTVGHPPSGGMIERIKRLLLTPKQEWPLIDAQPMTPKGIMTGWVLPLAAIGPVAHLVQIQLFPLNFMGVIWRPSLVGSVVAAIVSVILTLVFVYVWSLIIDALAPSFGGTKNPMASLKVAAFSATAAWVCGIFQILPLLSLLSILGLYSAYLFWIGLPMLMKVPTDKAAGYAVVTIVVGIVAGLVVGAISVAIAGTMFTMNPSAIVLSDSAGTVTIPGVGSINSSKIDDASAKMKAMVDTAAGTAASSVATKTVDPAALQNLIPAAVNGWDRTSVENSGGGAMGVNVSDATGTFTQGSQNFRLKVSDTGAMGSLAGMVNAQSSKQTATGYEKALLQDGNMVSEKWDTQSKSGTYSVLIGKRFLVEAEGSVPNIDTLKGAVAAITPARLEALPK